MLVLRKVAITGGLSSGKTAVCRFLKEMGAYVVSADEIVHELLSPHTIIGQKVIGLLGLDILKDGQIDRAAVAKKVFSQPQKLRALEQILHPAVIDEINKRYQQIKTTKRHSLFVAEIPLLYETDMHTHFDAVVAVVCDPILSKQRFGKDTSYSEDEFDRRMGRQWDPKQKEAKANFTITNNGTLTDLKESVKKLFQSLTK